MKKTLSVLLSAFLLFTADVLAGDKIIVLNTASNNGTMFSQSTAYAEDFKNMGYDVEFVSPGNACKAWAYLQKVPSNQPVFINIDAYDRPKLHLDFYKTVVQYWPARKILLPLT